MARKIVMVLMGLDIGGAETHVVELSKELKKRGCDVIVVSAGGAYERELTESGIPCVYAPLNKRSIPLMIRSYAILKKLILKEKPDIVHAHARIPAFLCGLLQKKYHFRFVTSAHGTFKVNAALKRLSNWGSRTISVSPDIREYLKKNYGLADDRITDTINGIDTEKFSAEADGTAVLKECGLENAYPVLVHVSRLDEDTSLAAKSLVRIAPKLKERFPGLGIIIAGGGNAFDGIKTAAGNAEYIKLLGARTDINSIVAAGTAFTGVSRAALEAMAEEKPVIIAGAQGYLGILSESNLDAAVTTNFCARGFDLPEDGKYLEDICTLLSLDEDRQKALGRFGRELVVRQYSSAKMTDDCEAVYDMMISEQTGILVSGYYGYGNLGDDSILIALRDELAKSMPGAKLTAFSYKPEETASVLGIRAVYRFNPFAILREIRNCNVFVSGGGSLLQDNTSTRSLIYYSTLIRIADHYGKKIMFYANGIGPVNQEKNRDLVRRVSDMADVISLREADSLKTLEKMGVKNHNIIVTADCVYGMEKGSRTEGKKLLDEAGLTGERPVAGISVRPVRGVETDVLKFSAFADMISQKGYDPVFIIMQKPADETAADNVISNMKHKAYKLYAAYNPNAMMGAIAQMDVVVSTRLHSIIFAAHEAVPVLGIVYDPKIAACLASLEMPSAGDFRDFDADKAIEAFDSITGKRAEYAKALALKAEELCRLAKQNNTLLLSLAGQTDRNIRG